MIDMQMLMIVLTAVASVLVTGWAEAKTLSEPGEGFIKTKHPHAGEDYYVVRAWR